MLIVKDMWSHRSPLAPPGPLWQYISLPRGGVRWTATRAGTLRTGYCGVQMGGRAHLEAIESEIYHQ